MSFTKFNKNTNRFDYQLPEEAEFLSLDDLYKKNGARAVYELKGLFINKKSKYGKHPVAIIENYFVSLPNHLLDVAEEILEDDMAIAQINSGVAGFKVRTYKDKKGETRYTVEWVDYKE